MSTFFAIMRRLTITTFNTGRIQLPSAFLNNSVNILVKGKRMPLRINEEEDYKNSAE